MIKKILKFVHLAPLTFPLVSWFKTAHTSHGIMVGNTPHVPSTVRARVKQRWRGCCFLGHDENCPL